MFGQVRVTAAGVGVALDDEVARTCAEVTDVAALAELREAMPNASPPRPTSATPIKSSRIAIRLIIFSCPRSPSGLTVGDELMRSSK
jgi:hypothetical protein